jgi:hypothetical protein
MISKLKLAEDGGGRLAIVFNGSPLFTGGAGSSEIRRWIIENDWLEGVVALPDQLFYNTGIARTSASSRIASVPNDGAESSSSMHASSSRRRAGAWATSATRLAPVRSPKSPDCTARSLRATGSSPGLSSWRCPAQAVLGPLPLDHQVVPVVDEETDVALDVRGQMPRTSALPDPHSACREHPYRLEGSGGGRGPVCALSDEIQPAPHSMGKASCDVATEHAEVTSARE